MRRGPSGRAAPTAIVGLVALAVLAWLVLRSPSPEPGPVGYADIPAATPVDGQLIPDPEHPAWLKIEGDGPFFLCGPGDPEGFLYRGEMRPDGTRDGDQRELIEKVEGTGANAIYLMAVRSHGGDGDATQNPFVDNDPARGLNEAVLDQWDGWFEAMDRAGIVIFFFFYDDSARIWDTGDRVGRAEGAFVRALVDRFKRYRHLVWVVAEEYQERFSPRRVAGIAATIRRADGYGHPVAVHKLAGLDFSEFAEDPVVDQFAIQYDAPDSRSLHDALVGAWREAEGRYNLNLAESHPEVLGTALRRRNWAAAMAGAYTLALGMDIANTPLQDLEDCGRLVAFMESTDFDRMSPRDDLAAADTDYVLAWPGHGYIAYGATDDGSPLTRLGLRDLEAGTWDLRWFDPVTGRSEEVAGVDVPEGEGAWAVPAGMEAEAVLYVTRRPEGAR